MSALKPTYILNIIFYLLSRISKRITKGSNHLNMSLSYITNISLAVLDHFKYTASTMLGIYILYFLYTNPEITILLNIILFCLIISMCIYEKLVNRFRRSKIKHPVPKELFNNFDEREIDHVAPPAPGSGFEVSNLVHSSNSDAKSILFETSIPVIQSQVQSQEDEVKQELYFDYEDDFIYSITLITPSLSVMITASEDWTSRFQKSFRYSIFDIQHNFPSTPEGEFYYYW